MLPSFWPSDDDNDDGASLLSSRNDDVFDSAPTRHSSDDDVDVDSDLDKELDGLIEFDESALRRRHVDESAFSRTVTSVAVELSTSLKNFDLNPQYRVLKRRGRSQWGGLLHLLYLPLLIAYLWWSFAPIYGPLPVCCACTTDGSESSVENEWIVNGNTAACRGNVTCRAGVQARLESVCRRAQRYEDLDDNRVNFAVDLTPLTCAGAIAGTECDDDCRALSDKWLRNVDYAATGNVQWAENQCARYENSTGVCTFMPVYYNDDSKLFPHGFCRYPTARGLLTTFGAALGLVSGLFVTVRAMMRTAVTLLHDKDEEVGSWRGLLGGFAATTALNYFGWAYFTLGASVTSMQRYGSQLAMGLLLLFTCSPLIVSAVYLLGELWPALLVAMLVRVIAVTMLLSACWRLILLDLDRNMLLVSLRVHARKPDSKLALFVAFAVGFVFTLLAVGVSTVASYHGMRVRRSRRAAIWKGALAGLPFWLLVVVWLLLSGENAWHDLTLDFPLDLPASMHVPLAKSVSQGAYAVGTFVVLIWLVFWFSAFVRELPARRVRLGDAKAAAADDKHATSGIGPRMRRAIGTNAQWRAAFVLCVLPALVPVLWFFLFSYASYQQNDPATVSECQFPLGAVVASFCSLAPGLLVRIFGSTHRMRGGAISAIGVNLIVLGEQFWTIVMTFCIGTLAPYTLVLTWCVQLVGSATLVYGGVYVELTAKVRADDSEVARANLVREHLLSSSSSSSAAAAHGRRSYDSTLQTTLAPPPPRLSVNSSNVDSLRAPPAFDNGDDDAASIDGKERNSRHRRRRRSTIFSIMSGDYSSSSSDDSIASSFLDDTLVDKRKEEDE
jgi:hypothetical protein